MFINGKCIISSIEMVKGIWIIKANILLLLEGYYIFFALLSRGKTDVLFNSS